MLGNLGAYYSNKNTEGYTKFTNDSVNDRKVPLSEMPFKQIESEGLKKEMVDESDIDLFPEEIVDNDDCDFPNEIIDYEENEIDKENNDINDRALEITDEEYSSEDYDNEIVNNDATEIVLRDLTEEEKLALREAGMSEDNIKKCKIDQNGKIYIKTINAHLEGTIHPETGIKYIRKTVVLNGIEVEGVFPEFNSVFECDLPNDLLKASDDDQFTYCMEKLKEALKNDPELRSKFSEKQLERIIKGVPPRIPGYTWHHNEVTGKMELVKDTEHSKSNHTGGKSMWGGGSDNR